MTIIVFLVDTSASMNQRAFIGGRPTLLDVAKNAVDSFVKVRQKSPDSRLDRYILMTYEDPPNHVKIGWKDNMLTFNNELKQLRSISLTNLGGALKNTFDFLNLNRMMSGIDTFGMGRNPYYLENAVIVCITDGGKMCSTKGVVEELEIPTNPMIPGGDLARDPFRWDQRLFGLVLRLSGTPSVEDTSLSLVPPDNSPIEVMCEKTGGRSYAITTHRMLLQCIDSLVGKIQSGVVLHFDKIGPDPPPLLQEKEECGSRPGSPPTGPQPWHSCKRMILVPRKRAERDPAQYGHWPIPESFWPDVNAPSLPPRPAHPCIKFACQDSEVMTIENLPFDKYELEPSPLTLYILSRKQPNVCWQVFVPNSSKNVEVSHPFGYLKANTTLQCVNLFVMPYNYPILLPLLDDVIKIHRMKPPKEWRNQFDNYVRAMPSYYLGPLKKALTRMGCGHLLMDFQETGLSYTVANYLKKVKALAKQEQERQSQEILIARESQYQVDGIRKLAIEPRVKLLSHPALSEVPKFKATESAVQSEFPLVIPKEAPEKSKPRLVEPLRNPFEIPRSNLLTTLARFRAQQQVVDPDSLHNVPIAQMGNYQDYSKRVPPLREVESTPYRQHMFGNPFKKMAMMVDEADIDIISFTGSNSGMSSKRRADNSRGGGLNGPIGKRRRGPLPRDFVWKPRGTNTPSINGPSSHSLYGPPDQPIENNDLTIEAQFSPPQADEEDERPPLMILDDDDEQDEDDVFLVSDSNGSSSTSVLTSLDYGGSPLKEAGQPPQMNGLPEISPLATYSPSSSYVLGGEKDSKVTPCSADSSSSLEMISALKDMKTAFASGASSGTESYTYHEVQEHNWLLQKEAMKLIRRPGCREVRPFVELLYNLKGDMETRIRFTETLIDEVNRFKKRSLASKLRNYLNSMLEIKRQLDWQEAHQSTPPTSNDTVYSEVNEKNYR